MKLKELHETSSEFQFLKTEEEIANWLYDNCNYDATNTHINDDLTVNSSSNITILNKTITRLPIQFGEVDGDFTIRECRELTTLIGCPTSIGGSFDCAYCESLVSLEGAPTKIGNNFSCYNCSSLKTLKGAPQKVGRAFSCAYCESLTSLDNAPRDIGEYFNCSACKSITSFKDIHKHIRSITGTFDASDIKISSGILGLLKIKGLRAIVIKNKEVEKIINNKYLPEGDLLDCIDELQDAGFSEYATL